MASTCTAISFQDTLLLVSGQKLLEFTSTFYLLQT